MTASRSGFGLAIGALAAGVLAWTTGPASAITLLFQDVINTNDPTFNQELGINNAGLIAGYFGSGMAGHPNQGYTVVSPFGQTNFTVENFPGSVQTQVTGLNNTGTTVGFFSNTNTGTDSNFGFARIGGAFVQVNNPNTGTTAPVVNQLLGVNDANLAVGFYIDGMGVTHGYTYDIMNAIFFANIDAPNAADTTAAAINNAGVIVGFYTDAAGVVHGFSDNAGTFKTIDVPGATGTSLLGVNNNGTAVGFDTDAAMQTHGIVCNIISGACQTGLDDPKGIGTTTFNGVNDNGGIVGFYVNGEGQTIGLAAAILAEPAPVPEPGSLALLSVGLFGIGVIVAGTRRRVTYHPRA